MVRTHFKMYPGSVLFICAGSSLLLGLFSSCRAGPTLVVAVQRLLIAVASLAEHRLEGAQAE